MKNKGGTLLGIVIGLGVGFFIDSSLIFFGSAWIFIFIVPMFIPIIACAVLGGLLGSRYLHVTQTKLVPLFVMLLGWPVALYVPHLIQKVRLEAMLREIPTFPSAEKVPDERFVTAAGDGGIWAEVAYKTNTDIAEISAFYRAALTKLPCVPSEQDLGYGSTFTCRNGDARYSVSVSTAVPVFIKSGDYPRGNVYVDEDTTSKIKWIEVSVEMDPF